MRPPGTGPPGSQGRSPRPWGQGPLPPLRVGADPHRSAAQCTNSSRLNTLWTHFIFCWVSNGWPIVTFNGGVSVRGAVGRTMVSSMHCAKHYARGGHLKKKKRLSMSSRRRCRFDQAIRNTHTQAHKTNHSFVLYQTPNPHLNKGMKYYDIQ